MKYDDFKKDLKLFEEMYSDVGKIPESMFKKCGYPDTINDLIKEDFAYVNTLIDFYYNHTKIQCDMGVSLNDIIQGLQIIKIQSNEKKIKFTKFSTIILKWLTEVDFFNDIYESFDFNVVDANDILEYKNDHAVDYSNIKIFEPRINQKDAFDRLEKNGLETGIHCQATGCGKTFIILKYIEYVRTHAKTQNPKIILFTERVNILADLFQFNKNNKNNKDVI